MDRLSISFKINSKLAMHIVSMLAFLLICACDDSWNSPEQETHDSYGLDMVVSIELTPEDISCMRNNTYAKPSVRTVVSINGTYYPASVSFSGATSVDDYRKSYEVVLDNAYEGRTVFRINAMPTDPSACRAMLSYTVFEQMGFNMPSYEPVALWINDSYAGLYLWQEKIDEEYFATRGMTPLSLYQAEDSVARMDDTANLDEEFSVKVGTKEMVDLKYMIQLLNQDSGKQNRSELEQVLNVDSVLRYMAVAAYTASHDGIINNFYLVRLKSDYRLQILPWDLDRTFFGTVTMDDDDFFARNLMMSRFYADYDPYGEKYRQYYQQAAAVAGPAFLESVLNNWVSRIRPAYENDLFLSTGEKTLDEHVAEIKSILNETGRCVQELSK